MNLKIWAFCGAVQLILLILISKGNGIPHGHHGGGGRGGHHGGMGGGMGGHRGGMGGQGQRGPGVHHNNNHYGGWGVQRGPGVVHHNNNRHGGGGTFIIGQPQRPPFGNGQTRLVPLIVPNGSISPNNIVIVRTTTTEPPTKTSKRPASTPQVLVDEAGPTNQEVLEIDGNEDITDLDLSQLIDVRLNLEK